MKKKERKVNLKKRELLKKLGIGSLAILATGSLADKLMGQTIYPLHQTEPQKYVLSPISMWSTADVIVRHWKNEVYTIKGDTKEIIERSDPDKAEVAIKAGIENANEQDIFKLVLKGYFNISSDLIVDKNNIVVEGGRIKLVNASIKIGVSKRVYNVYIEDMVLESGNPAMLVYGSQLNGVTIQNVRFLNTVTALKLDGSDVSHAVRGVRVINTSFDEFSEYGIYVKGYYVNIIVDRGLFHSSTGIAGLKVTSSEGGINVFKSQFIVNDGYGFDIGSDEAATLDIYLTNVHTEQCKNGNKIYNAKAVKIIGCNFTNNKGDGLILEQVQNFKVIGCTISNNNKETGNGGLVVKDSGRGEIIGNDIYDSAPSGSKTQKYGIYFTGSITDRILVIGNVLGVNANGPVDYSTASYYYRIMFERNIYYIRKNSGVATIPSGSTSVTVSHGLASAPSKVLVTPLSQPPGKIWVENITDTSFDIVTDTAPSSDLKVAWYAEV